jgi:Ca2+-binding RTX toxin-like protein
MNGGDGNDLLSGDTGHDLMTGGAGTDQFAFTAGQAAFVTTGLSAYVMDEITDFTAGTDKLALGFHPVAILQGSAATVAAAATWAAQALLSHPGATDVAAVTVGSDTYLFYDDHAKGGAIDAGIHLDHVVASGLKLTDFV